MTRGHLKIGVISDTHGLVRADALARLAGSAHILHAGDIGGSEVAAALERLAPVTAVRGNNDRDPWGRKLPETAVVELAGTRILLLHDLNQLAVDPVAAGCRVVISGHSHKPRIAIDRGVLFLNPGSAGPRRFRLPVTVAHLVLGEKMHAEIVPVRVDALAPITALG
jgi:putative phosphoesterase